MFILGTGCTLEPTFRLVDVEALVVGKSMRGEVEGRLGRPRLPVQGMAEFTSDSMEVSPPFPLWVFAWPFYVSQDCKQIMVKARFDEQGRLHEGSLSLWGHSAANIILLFYPRQDGITLDSAEEERLRAIRRNGFDVQIADAASGKVLSLEEYLKNKRGK